MGRILYKKLYLKEKEKNEKRKKIIDYYKKCLEYMNKKEIILYMNETQYSPYDFDYIEKTRIKVDDIFDLCLVVMIHEEDYEDWNNKVEV